MEDEAEKHEPMEDGGNKMLKKIKLYYFSPTGGTEKLGKAFAQTIAEETEPVDLGSRAVLEQQPDTEIIAVAAPVFGGRIPAVVKEKLQTLDGSGKKAVTLAVYGNRAYEDALLELNDVLTGCGFQVFASGALIAQHSMVPQVAAGRPDEQDMAELADFAQKALANLEQGTEHRVQVPGNRPYKTEMIVPAVPICLPACTCAENVNKSVRSVQSGKKTALSGQRSRRVSSAWPAPMCVRIMRESCRRRCRKKWIRCWED